MIAPDIAPRVPISSVRASGERNVRGLDSIRFFCALWVYFSHFGFLPVSTIVVAHGIVAGLYNNLFCGVGAVIAFFVISGFCIHYPFVGATKLPLAAFYTRRYVRIGVPLGAALVLASVLGADITGFYQTIIWSLVAELIYYTVYPLIRPVLIRWPSQTTIAAFCISAAIISTNPRALNFHQFGPALTWLVGLPSWILGCRLAIAVSSDGTKRADAPWLWRGFAWAFSSAASILRFHGHVGYPISLTIFGVFVFFWLREEVFYFRSAKPWSFAESSGKWSYSVYLIHGLAALTFLRIGFRLQPDLEWILQTIAVLAMSFGFFAIVERPSHRLARYLAKTIQRREAQAMTA